MKTLEKMLAGAHADQDKLRAEKTQLEAKNWELKNQLGDGLSQEKSMALGSLVYYFRIFSLPMLTKIFYWCRACWSSEAGGGQSGFGACCQGGGRNQNTLGA